MNNYAISTADLAQSLTKSSASLVAAGGNLAEAAALTATANKIIQDADSVGTALKTTSLRLRGTSVDILNEEGLDSEGAVTSKSKLQSKVKALSGVDILTATGEYKSTYEILSQIADVWEDINDMDQAALLELISGKRNASVIAAILQNPQELKEAFEDASDAEGSALRENEKYLDSIQGRIDLFTNSVQTMWKNALNSNVVKGVINFGTELIKLVDKIGLLPSILSAVFIYFTAFKKQNPLDWIKTISQYLSAFKGKAGIKQLIGQLLGIAPAMKIVTAETIANTVATELNDIAKAKQIMTEIGLSGATGTLSMAQKEQAKTAILNMISTKQLTLQQGSAMLAMLGFGGATMAADGSIKVLDATTKSFMASNPIGWILLAVSAIMMVVVAISKIPSKVERLNEKLKDLQSEISDIESEIDSLNSELETTRDRMAELLAMPSLSFTEQEELENLRSQTAELERQLEIQKRLAKSKDVQLIETTEDYIDKVWHSKGLDKSYTLSYGGGIRKDTGWHGFWTQGTDTKEALDSAISWYAYRHKVQEAYENILAQWDEEGSNKELLEKYGLNDSYTKGYIETLAQENSEAMNTIRIGIETVLGDENFDNLKYGMSDAIDTFLDEYYAYQYKWEAAQGVSNKSSVIASIFDDTSSFSIKKLKENLSDIASDDTLDAATKQQKASRIVNEAINSNTEGYKRLKTSMDIIGISAEEVARYFVQMSEMPDSSTVEGITAQYQKGVEALGKYKGAATDIIAEFTDLDGTVEQITWGSLFDDEGSAIDTQISKVLQGADETVRTEFAHIAEAVNEGKMTVENAMKSFSISGVQAGYGLLESAVVELNSDIFKDLGDEISGLIDTFDEFGSALESVANAIDLVNQAQAEMAYSGHVSVETALALINSTEDWNKVLQIENGNITLVDGAMDILAQSKLNQIKTNLQLALSEAQAGLEQARLAESSGEVAKTIEESTTESIRQLSANMGYLSTLIGEFLDGNFFGAHKAAKEAKQQILDDTEYEKTDTTPSMTVADWEDKVANIESKLSILEGVDTPSKFGDNYSSDKVSGGTGTKKEAEDKKIEDGWEALIDKYERELALITNERDLIEAEIDKAEARGGKASSQYYEDLIRNSNEEKELLEQKKKALENYLEVNANNIDPETWTEYNNEINATAVAIKECETNTIEWAEAIREIDLHYFEQTTEAISQLGEELDFVNSLLEDEEVADENGNWSNAALTRMGLYTQQIEKAAAETQLYQGQIDELNQQYENGELSEEEYQESLSDLVGKQRDAIQSYEDAKDGIVGLNEARIDAIKEGIEKEIEAYEDYIDVIKESLDAERDLYDFKKNVQKQSKDIASLERRIASLSTSTNASDIAERRKLEAQLLEAKEGLNDTYYEHSRDQQSQALDDEAKAFSKSKEEYIKELEKQLEDTETLIENSIMDVLLNADTVLAELNKISDTYGVDLSAALTQPWADASARAIAWKDELKESMESGEYATLIGEGGAITAFANGVATKLEGSWNSAQTAAQKYVDFLTKEELGTNFENTITGFGEQIQGLVTYWNNVRDAANEAYAAQSRTPTVGGNPNVGNNDNVNNDSNQSDTKGVVDANGNAIDTDIERLQAILNQFFGTKLVIDGDYGPKTTAAVKVMQAKIGDVQDGLYTTVTKKKLQDYLNKLNVSSWFKETGVHIPGALKSRASGRGGSGGGGLITTTMKYAKGTLGTSRDQWAITDELGDELVLVPGANGNLSFMRKGTSVVPADIAANLVEWGKLNPDTMKVGGGANINMISNAVNKPELNFAFDSLVHVDNCSQDTLKDLEKMVDTKINQFTKRLNYSLKGIGAK